MKKTKIICTIGPSSNTKKVLSSLNKLGVNIFRINMSHTKISDVPFILKKLKKSVGINKICIDTEGAQLRTTVVSKKIVIKKNNIINIFNNNDNSTSKKISLYPKFDILKIPLQSKIFVGFDGIILKVLKKNKDKNFLVTKVINSGILSSNKGVHIDKKINLFCLTEKDKSAILYAREFGIKNFAMSFVNSEKDVILMRKIIGKKNYLISKIETLNAIKNLKKISKYSNAVLIDRGDLSREVPIERIPLAQEYIINLSKKTKTPVFVATNLLETMIRDSQPTRAESHDIYSTLKQGASGLVLAAESAIGLDPIACATFLKKCISQQYKKFNSK